MKSICVFCGSNSGNNSNYSLAAQSLGKLLVEQNISLVYGGASIGLMGIIADQVLTLGGKAYGVIPKSMLQKEVAHQGLTELFIVDSMHERKQKMYNLSDGFIALPGGLGTLDELFEILTWAQLGLHHKACGILNIDHYFDELLKFLDQAIEKKFMKEKNRKLYFTDSNPNSLVEKMKEHHYQEEEKWIQEPDL